MKKIAIKLQFMGFYAENDSELLYLKHLLEKKYEIIDSGNPDFIIYSLYDENYLNYDCVKIFYTGENVRPNFNLCDYAMAFDWMSFEDRYYRFPYYRHRPTFALIKDIAPIIPASLANKKFCNFIYSNASASKERQEFFHLLSEYKKVDSGGKYLNNIGFPVDSKIDFMREYKFSIAFENVSSSGYTTEKILDAKVAGTIPIYWGNKRIDDDFNPKSFINCHDFASFHEVVEYVSTLDKDDNAYLEMVNQPVFTDNKMPEYLQDDSILAFLSNIIDQGPLKAKRRCGLLFESFIENDLKTFHHIRKSPLNYANYILNKLRINLKYKIATNDPMKPKYIQ